MHTHTRLLNYEKTMREMEKLWMNYYDDLMPRGDKGGNVHGLSLPRTTLFPIYLFCAVQLHSCGIIAK